MIGIVIDHDIVAIPIPVAAVTHIVGGNRKEEAAESEALRAASAQSPDMAATNAAGKTTVLPGVADAIVLIDTSGIVAHPAIILCVNVRGLGMSRLIGECAPLRSRSGSMRSRPYWGRAVSWNMPAAYPTFTATLVLLTCTLVLLTSALVVLCKYWDSKQQSC